MTALGSLWTNYHEACIVSFRLGPRHELCLRLQIPLDNHRMGDGPIVEIRFGAIENYADVKRFFESIEEPPDAETYWAEIDELSLEGLSSSMNRSASVPICLDHDGKCVIECRKITVAAEGTGA